jgi:hypothetical protein
MVIKNVEYSPVRAELSTVRADIGPVREISKMTCRIIGDFIIILQYQKSDKLSDHLIAILYHIIQRLNR